mgnify:CR=1 FL=1
MKTRLSLTALLLALVLGFAGCAKDEMDTTGDIAGVITDAKTNQVLAGANITLSPLGRSFTTGNDGRYSFSDIEVGTYTVQASKSGYSTNQRQVEVIAGEVSSLDIPLTPASSVLSLSIAPEALDFGSTTSALTLTLTNKSPDRSIINYTLASSNEWLLVSKQKGQFSYTEVITVSVDRNNLSEGDYSGQLTLTVEGQSTIIPVSMIVPAQTKPTVSMMPAEGVATTQAILRGSIVSVGSSQVVHHGFVWGTEDEPTLETAEKCDLGDAQAPRDFSYTLTALQPSTTYHVRAYAENNEGISYSESVRFTTKEYVTPPSVETGSTSDIQQNQATVSATLVALGTAAGVTAHGHVWSTHSNPTTDDSHTNLGNRTQTGEYSSTLTNLQPSTTYHVRAYATNEGGTSYGSDVTFTTRADMVSDGLYAYFPFNGNLTDATETGQTATGTGVSYTTSFDGSQALVISANASSKLSFPTPLVDQKKMSVSFWAKDLSDGHVFHAIRNENNTPVAFLLAVVDGQLKFVAGNYDISYRWSTYSTFTHGSLSGWHMITLVSDYSSTTLYATTTRLYIDGQLMDVITESNSGSGSNKCYEYCSKLIFGGEVSGTGNYFTGLQASKLTIDNLRFYRYHMLSADEVKQIYDFERQQ